MNITICPQLLDSFGTEFKINDSKINLRAFELSLHFPEIVQRYRDMMINNKSKKWEIVQKNVLEFKEFINTIINEAVQPEMIYLQSIEEKEMKNKEIKNIINEVIKTEEEYSKDITLYLKTYAKVLIKSKFVGELVRNSEVVLLNIIGLSNKISKILQSKNYSDLILCLDSLSVYDSYFIFYERIVSVMPKILKELPQLQEIKGRPEMKNLGVLDFLIKPIQRITKYPLFVKNLKENVEDLKDKNLLEFLDNYLNEQLNKSNSSQKCFSSEKEKEIILPLLKWKGKCIDLSTSMFIIKSSIVSVTQIEKNTMFLLKEINYCILFDSHLLLSRIKGSKIYIEKVITSILLIEEFNDHITLHSRKNVLSICFISKADQRLWITKLKEFKENQDKLINSFHSLSSVSSLGNKNLSHPRRPTAGSFDSIKIENAITQQNLHRTMSSASNPSISLL
ncbi:hypothetical protein EDI_291860 [Entamoeba dispar SAW760]|uniref:DH domain-containing protein n=1 Tax=Entamoeba dispar (strain ATCC PRA-260 / SAW760) TaxID=370354 RepID=B0EK60_ENTDS|nr:uncharacterized protein EDI_291860 [Entamoeba dispar SAW760]EDR25089.1 hypothetical protein EDI_291860 [Entamoeba dispar SAW760]|eukprot:EDR25089.1 hypothetical protein EDI_291860 [Entamoeba dispar SAW760]